MHITLYNLKVLSWRTGKEFLPSERPRADFIYSEMDYKRDFTRKIGTGEVSIREPLSSPASCISTKVTKHPSSGTNTRRSL